jgi:DNA-binding NtrC family response regulator
MLIRQLSSRAPDTEFHSATDPSSAIKAACKIHPSVVVCDLSVVEAVGPASGLRLVEDLLKNDPTCRVVVLTGHTDSEHGIAALKAGAGSFVTKPPDLDHLHALIVDGITYSNLKRENDRLRRNQSGGRGRIGLTSNSPKMAETLQQAEFAAGHSLPLLISGETGVGKGMLARAIHRAGRHKGTFIRFQPSHSGSELVSSELFGHERGAFTGALAARVGLLEEADHGTLFIDEVDELPNETQVLLLEALQEKKFKRLGGNREISSDFRIIAATNHPVDSAVKSGKLRPDFLHRIAQQRLEIPSLRDRLEDLALLADGFVIELSGRKKLPVYRITSEAITKLQGFSWPGNVRELQAVVELACYRAHADERQFVSAEDILFSSVDAGPPAGRSLRAQLDAFERKLVLAALDRANNNQTQAAKELGLDRTSLRRILAKTEK